MALESVDVRGEEYADSWKRHAHILDGIAVTMNCQLGSDNKQQPKELRESLAESLPKLISDLWRHDRQVDIICLQECPGAKTAAGSGCTWLEQTLSMLEDVSGDPWERVGDQSDTGSEFNVILFNAKKYKKSGNQTLPDFKLTSDYIGPNQIIKRHAYCCLEAIDKQNSKIQILSYHGIQNDTYRGQKARVSKQKITERYLEDLAEHVKQKNIPLLIGGDWNIDINPKNVGKHSKSMGRLMMPDFIDRACARHSKTDKIDYFVAIDHWDTRKEKDNFVRLINLTGRVEAAPHIDADKAKGMDHDPIFLPYCLFTLNCDGLAIKRDSAPRFPRMLVSEYLNKGPSRLDSDKNVVFPSRCLQGISDISTWGALLEHNEDELLIRYHYQDQTNTYLEGSDRSQSSETSRLHEKTPISQRKLRDRFISELQDQQQHGTKDIKNLNLTKTNLTKLDKGNKWLRRTAFPNLFGYHGAILTQKEAVDVCHDILCGEDKVLDRPWSQEQMNEFIDKKIRERREYISESVSNAFTKSSATERNKLFIILSDLLGKEIRGNQLIPKEIAQENLKRLRKAEILSACDFAGIRINRQATKATLCDKILKLKNDSQQYSTPERDSVLQAHLNFDSVASTIFSNRTASSLESVSSTRVQTAACESSDFGDEERKRIIEDGLIRVHREIRKVKGNPKAVMNKKNLRDLQNYLLKTEYPESIQWEREREWDKNSLKNNLLGKILGEQLWVQSSEYTKFKEENPRKFAATPYIIDYLMHEVKYDRKGFLLTNKNGHDPVSKRLLFE